MVRNDLLLSGITGLSGSLMAVLVCFIAWEYPGWRKWVVWNEDIYGGIAASRVDFMYYLIGTYVFLGLYSKLFNKEITLNVKNIFSDNQEIFIFSCMLLVYGYILKEKYLEYKNESPPGWEKRIFSYISKKYVILFYLGVLLLSIYTDISIIYIAILYSAYMVIYDYIYGYFLLDIYPVETYGSTIQVMSILFMYHLVIILPALLVAKKLFNMKVVSSKNTSSLKYMIVYIMFILYMYGVHYVAKIYKYENIKSWLA
jgi:hypothetical protein